MSGEIQTGHLALRLATNCDTRHRESEWVGQAGQLDGAPNDVLAARDMPVAAELCEPLGVKLEGIHSCSGDANGPW